MTHTPVWGGGIAFNCAGGGSVGVFTCSGAPHFTGSAEVVTSLLTGGTQASRLHWGRRSGAWGVAEIFLEISTQDAWQRQEGRNWAHWVDKHVCVRDDAYTCVGGGGRVREVMGDFSVKTVLEAASIGCDVFC